MLKKEFLSILAVVTLGLAAGGAQADLVPNGEFIVTKPGEPAVTGVLDGPGVFSSYVQGVGTDLNVANNDPLYGTVTWDDGSGTTAQGGPVDLLGWVSVNGTNTDLGKNGVGGSEGLNMFAGWGGQQRIESDASLGVIGGGGYTISVQVDGNGGGPVNGPLVFDLMANGVALTASSSIGEPVPGDAGFKTWSRTYDAASLAGNIGEDLTIVLGTADLNLEGGRIIFDDVMLTSDGPDLLPGDVNNNGVVDREDLALFVSQLGKGPEFGFPEDNNPDFDGDFFVTLIDAAIMQGNLSQPVPSPIASSVPEPTTLTLTALALVGFAMRRRRGR